MKLRFKYTITFAACCLISAPYMAGCLGSAQNTSLKSIRITPEDNKEALINPGMGWVHHYYSGRTGNYGYYLAPSDSLDWFPGASVQYMRIPWAFVEPEEGKFNWQVLDTPAQRYIEKGKKLAIRINACEHWIPYATPQWLEKKACPGVRFTVRVGPDSKGACWEPDYLSPIFLESLEKLVKALAERYDGNENVAFIDIGTFGLWGEGHTGLSSKRSREYNIEAAKKQIDIYTRHFKKTLLCISDDVDGAVSQGPFPVLDYARSKGVSLRDDSIMVSKESGKRKPWYHAELAGKYWRDMPVIVEHEHYGLSKIRGAWSGELLQKAVEAYHCSYLSIHWWPEVFYKENKEAIENINLRLGYRLNLKEFSMPSELEIGEAFTAKFEWANAGVAPMYEGAWAAITLKDSSGGIVAVLVDDTLNMKDLPVAPKGRPKSVISKKSFSVAFLNPPEWFNEYTKTMEYREGAEFYGAPTVPATKAGVYEVYISVGTRDGTPKIALPLDLPDDGKRRYKVGEITLKAPKNPGLEVKTTKESPLSTMDYINGKKVRY